LGNYKAKLPLFTKTRVIVTDTDYDGRQVNLKGVVVKHKQQSGAINGSKQKNYYLVEIPITEYLDSSMSSVPVQNNPKDKNVRVYFPTQDVKFDKAWYRNKKLKKILGD